MGLLRVGLGAAVELKVPSPGRVLVQMGGRNRRAASSPQGLLLSLGVEGHVAMVTTSGQDGPEGGDRRIQSGSLWSLRFLKGLLVDIQNDQPQVQHREQKSRPPLQSNLSLSEKLKHDAEL